MLLPFFRRLPMIKWRHQSKEGCCMQLNQEKIGQFISACRKAQGFTQADLGERLGVSPQSVSNWERGESLPDIALLPDLAAMLHSSVDAILLAGEGTSAYRRHVTVEQARQALLQLDNLRVLLGEEHFVYQCLLEALNARMNTRLQDAFSDPHIAEVFIVEFLLGCLAKGDYVDPRDVEIHLAPGKARDCLHKALRERGIR